MVKRFKQPRDEFMGTKPDGEWVRFKDYDDLRAQLAAVVEAARRTLTICKEGCAYRKGVPIGDPPNRCDCGHADLLAACADLPAAARERDRALVEPMREALSELLGSHHDLRKRSYGDPKMSGPTPSEVRAMDVERRAYNVLARLGLDADNITDGDDDD